VKPTRDAVLVLTQDVDPTADLVHDHLQERDVPVVRFDSAAFPRRARLSIHSSVEGWQTVLHTENEAVDLGTLRSIWYRRPAPFQFVEDMTPETEAFARAEARQAFSGALHASPASWLNPPGPDARASLKPLQLQAAQAAGLAVPETLVTNDPNEARAFLEGADGPVIYKRLSSMLLYTDDGRLTGFQTELVDAAALERLAHVAVTPCLFQRYVEKAYELRVTIVAGRAFAARIDSQDSQSANGRLDWRVAEDLDWTPYVLPAELERRAVRLVEGFGLVFGALDFIRRPDGEYVFLELNPSGQWAWFDDEITLPIRNAIVDALEAPSLRAPRHARATG
jgi:ATP-grasp ribosomal peptide maturase